MHQSNCLFAILSAVKSFRWTFGLFLGVHRINSAVNEQNWPYHVFFFLRGVPRFTSRHKKIANTPPSSRLFKRYQLLWDCGAAINIFRDQRFKFFKLCDLVTKKISQLISEINFSVADDFSGRLPLSWFRVWHFFRIYSVYLLHHVSEENFSVFLYLRLQ